MNKKFKITIIISLIIIIIVGILIGIFTNRKRTPEEMKEDLNNSITEISNKSNYTITLDLMYGYYGNDEIDATTEYNKTVYITFDENNKITEKNIHIKDIPTTTEYIKFEENKIIRYYGDMVKNELYLNTYYLKEWNKVELDLNNETKEQYTYLDKNFYIGMIKNATNLIDTDYDFSYYVNKSEIEKILNQIDKDIFKIEKDVLVNQTNEKGQISYLEIPLKEVLDVKYDYVNLTITFELDFSNNPGLELPEIN